MKFLGGSQIESGVGDVVYLYINECNGQQGENDFVLKLVGGIGCCYLVQVYQFDKVEEYVQVGKGGNQQSGCVQSVVVVGVV